MTGWLNGKRKEQTWTDKLINEIIVDTQSFRSSTLLKHDKATVGYSHDGNSVRLCAYSKDALHMLRPAW